MVVTSVTVTCCFEKLSHIIVTHLGYTMDLSWNEIFMDQEACAAHDSSDSSDNSNYVPSEFDEASDDDIGTSHQQSFSILHDSPFGVGCLMGMKKINMLVKTGTIAPLCITTQNLHHIHRVCENYCFQKVFC